MAALSAAGSFAQAVTTWDKSCPALTRLCEATCEGETVLAASLLGSWRVRAPRLLIGLGSSVTFIPHADKTLRLALAIPRSSAIEAALQRMEMSYTFRKSSAMNLRYQIENRAAAASTVAVPFSRQSLMTVT